LLGLVSPTPHRFTLFASATLFRSVGGDQQLAVVAEIAGREVLDGAAGAVVGFELAVDGEHGRMGDGAAAVDGGVLQLQGRAGAGDVGGTGLHSRHGLAAYEVACRD